MSPAIATALKLFDFDIIHIKDTSKLGCPRDAEDLDIIRWCKDNKHVFITHDYSTRKQYEADMRSAPISVLWIRGHPEQTATWLFFKMVIRVIDEMHSKLRTSRGAIHFKVGLKGGSTPEIIWAQFPEDRPRREHPQRTRHLKNQS